MANFFDQFDAAPAPAPAPTQQNFFDQFDAAPAQPAPGGGAQQQPQTAPLDVSKMSKEALFEAYKTLPKDDPNREVVKQRLMNFDAQPMSKLQSGIAGATDTLSFGFSDEINAGLAAVTGGDYDAELTAQRQMNRQAEEDNPGSYLTGQIAGSVPQIALTLGSSAPLTAGGRLASNMGYGALQSGVYGFGAEDGDLGDRVGSAASGAAFGAALGVLPSAAEGIYKGGKALIGGTVRNVQKVTNPRVAAEKELVRQMQKDWRANAQLEKRALDRGKPTEPRRFLNEQDMLDAEAAGQRTMVADIGGDATRRKLKAADNVSEDASNLMRGAAKQRQVDSGTRVTQVVSDTFGDVNPKTIRDQLIQRARTENDAAYKLAEQNPNAQHLWNPVLQRALSTSYGKQALKSAITKSRNKALRNGEEIVEPIFAEGPDGLMEFTGKLRLPTGEIVDDIQGVGMSLRFWDSVKKSMDDDISELKRAGRNEEVADLTAIKNEMIRNLDEAVPEYGVARGTARDFFGMEDAHEAGAEYFRNIDAFDIAEARAAMETMKPAERELFARGYAAELVTRISKMGDAENVAKLFKNSQARMKMRDALGDDVADQLEAFTHREMVQGLLGRHLGENSTTIQQQIAQEGLRMGAAGGAGGGYSYFTGGDLTTGLLAGMAIRGGYRFTQREVVKRYAREMAELAISDDPDTIARILSKVSKDPGYLKFSRAVASGASGAGRSANPGGLTGGAERVEPRMPFAAGGVVKMANAGLVKKAAKAAAKLLKGVDEKPPKAVTDLGVRPDGAPVMLDGKDVSQWTPGDWGAFGRQHGRDDVGPLSDEEFMSSLVELPTKSGRTFTVPGGIDDVEKPFTYYDLLHLKSQAVDPNDLDPDIHRRLHNRMVRSMQPGPEFDDVDRYNQLAFGMISPNQPLTPNEFAMARVRAKSPEDIKQLADMAPWSLGDEVTKQQRQELSRGIARYYGLQSKGKGGIGASGSADYSRIADMAKMHSEKPEFYRFAGAAEGGADDAENWSNFAGRVAAQTPGLSYKTASLGTVWQDPANAAISAIDRHMAGSFRGALFEKQKDVDKFNRRVLQKFNKGRPRGQGAKNFDEMLEMPGGRGVLVDELFVELNRRGKTKLRSAKTGELNPKAPEWARNADWIREPEKVDKMSAAYVRALRENDRLARENNQGLFANQWMIWDRIRERLEPHEIMHPSIRHLPRMTLDQIKAADKAHMRAGYKAESGKARPASPSELAYFSVAPLGGLGVLAGMDDEQGQ